MEHHISLPRQPGGSSAAAATLDLDLAGLSDFDIQLEEQTWRVTGSGRSRALAEGGRVLRRIKHRGVTYLLVGGNGHASVLTAIRTSKPGDTILVAPGTYRETEAFIIDRPITLLGVSANGTPIRDNGNIAATIVALQKGDGKGFVLTASGVVIAGLALVSHTSTSADIRRLLPGVSPQIRLSDRGGNFKHLYPNIQAALDAADEDDCINVPAGRHVGDLYVRRSVTLSGANAGRPGESPRRDGESTLLGQIQMGAGAASLVLDGLALRGAFDMEPTKAADRRFSLRNCVMDGRDADCAISVAQGAASEIFNNMVYGGSQEAIRVGNGFDGLSITGNRIQIATRAVGIALKSGRGSDHIEILANTFLDGDYSVLIRTECWHGEPGDSILLSGNHFGEECGSVVRGAPMIAAVHTDGGMPASLELLLGFSIDLNTYHELPPDPVAEVLFDDARSRKDP
jgi:hypothetical protein